MDAAHAIIQRIQSEARRREGDERPRWPMVILSPPKRLSGFSDIWLRMKLREKLQRIVFFGS